MNNTKLIIVEGCDGVGKGYFIERLAKKLGNTYIFKNTFRPRNSSLAERKKIVDIYFDIFEIFMNQRQGRFMILDRYYFSEMVYCFKRGYDATGSPELKELEEKISASNHLLLYIDRDNKEIEGVYKTRGEDFVKSDEIDIIKNKYQELYAKSNFNKMKITSNDVDKVFDFIQNGVKY